MRLLLLLGLVVATCANGLGRLLSPPHRGYLAQLSSFATLVPPDFDDDELDAGGIVSTNRGLHGTCGDDFNDQNPRAHETGGVYGRFPTDGKRVVGACYAPGQVIDVAVELTAQIPTGFFEFALCKLAGRGDRESDACFQSLHQPNGQSRVVLPPRSSAAVVTTKIQLPAGLNCEGESHCVLRWWWAMGDPATDVNSLQQVWNCADVYISESCGTATFAPASTPTPTNTPSPTLAPTDTPAPTSSPSKTPSPTTAPTTPAPTMSDKCDGNHNVCYWPANHQVLPYGQSDCVLFSTFVWCP
ncbi:Aste57867_2660 [Aphanomyces stellatus]|uniref:Aste57867_2660 protein n=1 Tax=Aphanomyces stellatus TaxID=120398 RepID=A0A485KAJ8_9STRA|nr:hypothetical protein As57867_002653 [Aphanomyces stellatus]VFT79854.1 Aste57867_2660 [Aphanomyces stellatus]